MARTTLTKSDRGKRVQNADGETVGRIVEVRGGRGFVDPDASFLDSIKARMGWSDAGAGTKPVKPDDVEQITGRVVHLRRPP